MNEHIQKSIDELNAANDKFQADVNGANNNSNDNPQEDAFGQLGLRLFNQITETTIKIIETPEVENSIVTIATEMNMGQKSISALINLIAVAMTNSAQQAILFYDDLLKDELTKQFDNIGKHINLGKADMEGFKAALQVHQKQIGEINKTLLLNNLKKVNDESVNKSPEAPVPNVAKPFK